LSDPIEVLKKELPLYIDDVKNKHSENSKSMAFSSFIQKVFGIKPSEIDFEVSINSKVMQLKGRIDAVFGNMLIEFKRDLSKGLDEAKEELIKYFQSYHEKFPDSKYIGIANDGILFKVYQPIKHNDVVTELEEIGAINLETSTPEDIFNWFDGYFFTSTKIIPTSEHLKQSFGINSPTYAVIRQELLELFEKVKDDRHVKMKYENWSRYLEIVYGDAPNEINLFIAHTYVSTFAKLLVYMKLSGQSRFSNPSIPPILYGNIFSQYGIRNFVEDDFFTWIMYITIRQRTSKIFEKLLRDMEVYDLDQIDEDILKELYQDMVHPLVRKQLGEFYTPDWLAEKTIDEVLHKNPSKSVLDPSCGSGTFLFKTIFYKIKNLREKNMGDEKILYHILESVIGFDIHPLAALIAKTNYLLALKDVLHSRKGPITIPVYLSDSLKLPSKKMDVSNPVTTFEFETQVNKKKFSFPSKIIDDMIKMDDIIEKMKEYGHQLEDKIEKSKESSYKFDADETSANLENNFHKAIVNVTDENERKILVHNIKTLFELIKEENDSIWPYVIRNMYKPVTISNLKVDVILGNPPWITMQNMKNIQYQDFLKREASKYGLVEKGETHQFPHIELATLFFCLASDLYLKKNGEIGFVMPKSVLLSSHHVGFRKFEKPLFKLEKILDVENVEPLFRIPSCVIICKKDDATSYPVPMKKIEGKLERKNANLREAMKSLTITETTFEPIKTMINHSKYYEKFYQGATIVPRNFFFVEIVKNEFLGINLESPKIRSDEKNDTKMPWTDIILEGEVESNFFYGSLLGADVVPFGNRGFRLVVLPIIVSGQGVKICKNHGDLLELGFNNAAKYFEMTENNWKKYATGKAKAITIYDWINYRNKIENQNLKIKYKVLYVASSTYMASCVVSVTENLVHKFNNSEITLNGFIAESKTYYYETGDEKEAHYLCAIFNSKIIDDLIKPLQTHGLWGERDIHKRPLSLPIPTFSRENPKHLKLAELSKICHKKVPDILLKINSKSVGKIRTSVRNELAEDMEHINKLTRELLIENGCKF